MVSKMIRQRKEYVCSVCGAKSLKFSGYCPSCKKAGTMKEHQILPAKVKTRATPTQKSIRRRATNSERNISRSMQDVDGPDPIFRNVTSSTGRVGHITGMQIDAITLNYVIENKNRTMPLWINKAWIQIQQRAVDFGKHPLLHIEPSNIAKEFPINGGKRKTETMAIIGQNRHESLIRSEKATLAAKDILDSSDNNLTKIRKLRELFNV